jgi:predicted dehydrogenase
MMGWSVDMYDIDEAALLRTKNEIFPSRYGHWDEGIRLFRSDDVTLGSHDLVIIGTPPDSHIELARAAVKEGARAVLIEKPACTPDLEGAQDLYDEAEAAGCKVFVGYDHAVATSTGRLSELLERGTVGVTKTLDVEFRENWGGIFDAHPWLDGPSDTYLGYWRRGGGACGEHSHAINLWQHLACQAGRGRILEVTANINYVKDGLTDYDNICLLHFKTETGMIGRVVQDVITKPTRKWARVQGECGHIEWYCGQKPGVDTVICAPDKGDITITDIRKTRPDDFLSELQHIDAVLKGEKSIAKSPLSLSRGLDSMLVIAAAHMSEQSRRTVSIDYSKGYSVNSLSLL